MDARARTVVALVAVVALGIAGVFGYWLGDRPQGYTNLDRVSGITTAVNIDGTAIGVRGLPERFHTGGFEVGGAWGRECLVPLSSGQRVELGVIHTRPDEEIPGTHVVAWLKCLSPPTERNRR